MIPALIAAGASLLGGLMNKSSNDDNNAAAAANAERNIAMQKEFAQSGIQWKVEDAKKAGVHPLYAIGAQGASFSPVSYAGSADTSMGSAIASSGQDISRAMQATQDKDGRVSAFDKTVQDLTIQKMGLENGILASQLAKQRAQIGPAMPSLTDKNPLEGQGDSKRPNLHAPHGLILTPDKKESQAKAWEDEYGEAADIIGAWRMLKDAGVGLGNYLAPPGWGPRLSKRWSDTTTPISASQRRFNWRTRGQGNR